MPGKKKKKFTAEYRNYKDGKDQASSPTEKDIVKPVYKGTKEPIIFSEDMISRKDGGSVQKMKYGGDPTGNTMSEADMQRVQELMGRTKTKETGNAISDADLKKIKALLAGAGGAGIGKGMPKMKFGGKVQKMEDGGKAVPVAKVKIERLKKMRDPYGESNFAHQISDGKDAYTQRVIAAMKESGQPFMYGGKVKKMRNGGSVNTTKSIQLNPKTGEPI